MPACIHIVLPLAPTDDDLRRGREVLALLSSFATGAAYAAHAATAAGADDDTPPDANAPTHDNTGLIFDARIHSGARKLNADGTWKKRRGVQDAEVTRIETELRAQSAAFPPHHSFAVPPPPAAVVPPPPVALPAPPPPLPAAGTKEPTTFVELLKDHMTPAMVAQRVTMPELIEHVAVPLGLANVAQLATQPTLVPAAYALLTAYLATKG